MGKIFSFLGVSSDAILSKMSHTDKKMLIAQILCMELIMNLALII